MIDVLMSVRNSQAHLRASIESVLNQTLSDFTFYIVDDASTDGSVDIINSYRDKRIVFLRNTKPRGLTKNLNFMLDKCRECYIARQDADDVSCPTRFEKQIAYLTRGGFDLIGCDANIINRHSKQIGKREYKGKNIKIELFKKNIFIHSSWFGKKSMFKYLGGYDENYMYAQDYDLLLRAIDKYKLGILPEKLVDIRFIPESVSGQHLKEQQRFGLLARWRALKRGTYSWSEARYLFQSFVSYILPAFINKFVYKNIYGY
jgi:glycosyltransferase involved in cell wall biosynthesis